MPPPPAVPLSSDERCNQREDEGNREHQHDRDNDGRCREALETAKPHSRLHVLLINHRARMTRCLIGRCDVAHSWAMRAVTLGVDSVRLRPRMVPLALVADEGEGGVH